VGRSHGRCWCSSSSMEPAASLGKPVRRLELTRPSPFRLHESVAATFDSNGYFPAHGQPRTWALRFPACGSAGGRRSLQLQGRWPRRKTGNDRWAGARLTGVTRWLRCRSRWSPTWQVVARVREQTPQPSVTSPIHPHGQLIAAASRQRPGLGSAAGSPVDPVLTDDLGTDRIAPAVIPFRRIGTNRRDAPVRQETNRCCWDSSSANPSAGWPQAEQALPLLV